MQTKELNEYELYQHLTDDSKGLLEKIEEKFGAGIVADLDDLFGGTPDTLDEDAKFKINMYNERKNPGDTAIRIKPAHNNEVTAVKISVGPGKEDPDAYEMRKGYFCNSNWKKEAQRDPEEIKQKRAEKYNKMQQKIDETPTLYDAPEETKAAIEEYKARAIEKEVAELKRQDLEEQAKTTRGVFDDAIAKLEETDLPPEIIEQFKTLFTNFETLFHDIQQDKEEIAQVTEETEKDLGDLNDVKTPEEANIIHVDFNWGDVPGKTLKELEKAKKQSQQEPEKYHRSEDLQKAAKKTYEDIYDSAKEMETFNAAGADFVMDQALNGMEQTKTFAEKLHEIKETKEKIAVATRNIKICEKGWNICKDAVIAHDLADIEKLNEINQTLKAKEEMWLKVFTNANFPLFVQNYAGNIAKTLHDTIARNKAEVERKIDQCQSRLDGFKQATFEARKTWAYADELKEEYGIKHNYTDKLADKILGAEMKTEAYQNMLNDAKNAKDDREDR